MAGAYVLILVPETIERDAMDDYVEQLFFPFSRDYDFPPFKCPCEDCIDGSQGVDYANDNLQHFHKYWRSYNLLPQGNRPDWNDYISEWSNAALAPQPDLPPPDPSCDRCEGLGYFASTFYPGNMYDYWVNLEGEVLGPISELKTEWNSFKKRDGREVKRLRIKTTSVEAFSFDHFITPDGQPFNQKDFRGSSAWKEAWETEILNWENTIVVRCLVHA